MDIGKEVSNHYKPEFEFSKLYFFIFLILCFEFVVIEKFLKTQFTPPPPFWVFFLTKYSLCFLNINDKRIMQIDYKKMYLKTNYFLMRFQRNLVKTISN